MKLFSTLAVKKAFDDGLLAEFTRRTGIVVEGVYDPTTQLEARIAAGERPDVMIAITPAFAGLDVLDLSTQVPIAKTGVGLAVPPDAALPDISTVDALVKVLLAARSVAYSRTGASGIYFARLIKELGIAEEVDARATVIEKGFIAHAVVDGRADVAIQQLSELRFVPEARIAGPLPAEVQHYSEFSAVAARAGDEEAAAFIRFLTSDAARDAYARTGLELP
ncbi:substrate-binding domain-containing protein [Nonomuraea typhae]|uniref:substrate-binding domain-containing protein n=1 Tax=Nonomuraea typhae TaxID=2603600 RepID=UPI0012FBA314|nr:substrate-binding domain-containing protein [Nonomuraea typhae]